jgi:hypothetical protein
MVALHGDHDVKGYRRGEYRHPSVELRGTVARFVTVTPGVKLRLETGASAETFNHVHDTLGVGTGWQSSSRQRRQGA